MTIDDHFKNEKIQSDINKEAAKISAIYNKIMTIDDQFKDEKI